MRNKYKAKKTVVDGITFDSKAESVRYCELRMRLKDGEISDLKLQPKFELVPKSTAEKPVVYIADFTYTENEQHIVEDVKGMKTRDYIIKRKLFKQKYPDIVFREVVR